MEILKFQVILLYCCIAAYKHKISCYKTVIIVMTLTHTQDNHRDLDKLGL